MSLAIIQQRIEPGELMPIKGMHNRFVNFLTGRDLKTVLHPATNIKNEITLSTQKDFNYHAYVLSIDALEFAENNTIMTKLPKKSNIKEIIPILDNVKKDIRGDKLSAKGDEYVKVMWVDRFNRTFASKIETPDSINVVVRADIVNNLFLKKKMFVQCTTATCDVIIPSTSYIDYKEFLPRDPTKKEKSLTGSGQFSG
jgi:hypothetical protein